jgi:hypothetical protein
VVRPRLLDEAQPAGAAALARDDHLALVEVEVRHVQPGHLRQAHAAVDEEG